MADLATTRDRIAGAFVAVLKPGGTWTNGAYSGGTPVGTVGDVVKRTPDAPYGGPLPLVTVTPVQNRHGRDPEVALAKFDQGVVEIVYRDKPLDQYQADDPAAGMTQQQLEDRLWANEEAIIAAIDGSPTLAGAVTIAGESTEAQYNPDGPYETWQGAEWMGFTLHVSYVGPLL
jgi:hypothetical protein